MPWEKVNTIRPQPNDNSPQAQHTATFLNNIISVASRILASHPLNINRKKPVNNIHLWSPGYRPVLKPLSEKYPGTTGAVISAVDVISGIGRSAGMDLIRVPGATGFIDTNYKGKALAAIEALKDHNFVYLHVEAIDECGHIGDLELKIQAIEDFDSQIVGPVLSTLQNDNTAFSVLPDHPVPIKQRKHTRTPVPVAVCAPHISPDRVTEYSEKTVHGGSLGLMKGEELMRLVLNLT